MSEPVTPPELGDWPEDHLPASFVMIQIPTTGRKRARFLSALGMMALIVMVLALTTSFWMPTVQRQWERIFPPPPYTGPITVVQEINDATLLGLRSDTGQVQWKLFPIAAQSQAIQVGNIVVANELDGITGLRVADGHKLWHTTTPAGYTTPQLGRSNGNQILAWFPSSDGKNQPIYQGIDAQSGAIQWQYQGDGYRAFLAQPSNTLLLCSTTSATNGARTSHIVAFDIIKGKPIWASQSLPVHTDAYCFGTASVAYLETAANTGTTTLWAYALQTGQALWHQQITDSLGGSDDDHIYLSNWYINKPQGSPYTFTAYDAATGKRAWQIPGQYQGFYYPAAQSGTFPTLTPTGIAGIDSLTGQVQWHFDPPTNNVRVTLEGLSENTMLYYYYTAAHLYAVDRQTGTIHWSTTIATSPANGALTSYEHRLYFTTDTGLMVFDETSGRQLWKVAKLYTPIG